MPHLIIEHSANVGALIDIGELVDAMHDAALSTGIAPIEALRTRAARRDVYAIADQHPDNAFVAITARLGAGRTDEDKRRLVEVLMETLDELLGEARRDVMLSVEYQEIDPAFRLNRNHLREVIGNGR